MSPQEPPRLDARAEIPTLTDHAESSAPAPLARASTEEHVTAAVSQTGLRAALESEAPFIIDQLLDEMIPRLEARLRERLIERSREILKNLP